MANTDRTNEMFRLIGNASTVVDLSTVSEAVTIAPNVNVISKRYSGDNYVRSIPTSTNFSFDYGDLEYNDESNKLVAIQSEQLLMMVGQADTKEKVWFGTFKTAGLPFTPQEDDLAIYGFAVTQDGLFCASGSSGCAKSFEVASGAVNSEWAVPAGTYSANTRIFIAVTEGTTGGTPTLSVDVTTPTTASVASLSAAVGLQEVEVSTALAAALPSATGLRIRASSSPTSPIRGYVVLAEPMEVS